MREDATLPSAREAKLLGNLRHPFIVQFFTSFLEKKDFCIVTEYCEGGDLDCYIQRQKDEGEDLTEGHVMEWFIQLLLGVNYLHERLVMHRDLKTKNIFLKDGILKIGDFGVSRILVPSDMATTITGTASYMSPELFSNTGYNTKCDIWSLGCILYEMCSLTRAFDCPKWIKLVSLIVNGPSPTLPLKYSAALNDILQRMLRKEPALRPSANEILQFPYVTHRGQVLSQWLQEVIRQDRKDSVDEDVARITAAIRAVQRVYEENHQRMEQNRRHQADDDVQWVEDRATKEEDICSEEDEESTNGSLLTISLPLSEQQSSTLSAYKSCLQRFLDSGTDSDSVPQDSEDTIVSVCSEQEIALLRQECVRLLGQDAFMEVYNYWKQVYNQQYPDTAEIEERTLCEPEAMKLHPPLCDKVQQLLFLEERIEVESSEPSFTWL
ncbi:serine/threonine-protein kinase Nek11-like isoform 2-T2 [Anomaloglossus baeobatrachus]